MRLHIWRPRACAKWGQQRAVENEAGVGEGRTERGGILTILFVNLTQARVN